MVEDVDGARGAYNARVENIRGDEYPMLKGEITVFLSDAFWHD